MISLANLLVTLEVAPLLPPLESLYCWYLLNIKAYLIIWEDIHLRLFCYMIAWNSSSGVETGCGGRESTLGFSRLKRDLQV